MPHFLVDDGFAFHRKTVAVGNAAIGLWTRAGSWCRQQLSDGHVPTHIARAMGTPKEARALVAAGLWIQVEDGYQFHGWEERQTTREEVLAKRAAARERMEKARARSQEVRANREGTSPEVTSTPSPSPSPSPERTISATPSPAPASEANTQTLVGEWLERQPARPPGRVVGQVSRELKIMLEEGIAYEDVRAGLAAWHHKSLHPSALASVVHETRKARASTAAPDWQQRQLPTPPADVADDPARYAAWLADQRTTA